MAEALSLKVLAEELKQAGAPWEMDRETSMARMTEDERRRMLGFTPPPEEMQLEEAALAFEKPPAITAAEIAADMEIGAPAAFDLRNVGGKNFTTSVKNQGGCGSCVAHGVAAVLETRYKRQYNKPTYPIDLSEAHLFYCHAKEEGRTCANGWWPGNALVKAKDKGVTLEQFFPYTAGDQNCNLTAGWQNNLARSVGHTKMGSRAAMKQWIATKGSITGCFVVYQDFFAYRSGVYRHVSGGSAGGHCIEIIGYSDAQGCWICKNSWGTNWGEGGYFRIAYGQCGIETWSGPWGCNGVSLRIWNRNRRVNGLWADERDRNAWVHLTGVGWRALANTSVAVQHTMLAELVTAKAGSRRVDALEDANRIRQVYVI